MLLVVRGARQEGLSESSSNTKFIKTYIANSIISPNSPHDMYNDLQNMINGSLIRDRFKQYQPPSDRDKPLSPDVPSDSGMGTSWTSVRRPLSCKGV